MPETARQSALRALFSRLEIRSVQPGGGLLRVGYLPEMGINGLALVRTGEASCEVGVPDF